MKQMILIVFFAFCNFFATGIYGQTVPEQNKTSKSWGHPVTAPNRSIFINGIDISSARNQDLRNVHVRISESGDIFISAPQYQVTEEETFLPLSPKTKSATPVHKEPQSSSSTSQPSTNPATPVASTTLESAPTKIAKKAPDEPQNAAPSDIEKPSSPTPPKSPAGAEAPGEAKP